MKGCQEMVRYHITSTIFFFLICIKHQIGSFSAIFMTRGNVNNINFVGNFDKHVSGNLDSHSSENIALQRAINDHF